jgi:hypothetical protein
MPRYPACIWCRKKDSPQSAEDIFARWIARKWPDKKKSHFHVEGFVVVPNGGSSPPEKIIDFSGVGQFGFLTHGPCTRCK